MVAAVGAARVDGGTEAGASLAGAEGIAGAEPGAAPVEAATDGGAVFGAERVESGAAVGP